MNDFVNPYLNPYLNPNFGAQNFNPTPQVNTLPPQQILQANGKASIDALKMSPNSSCLIADSTEPIVWKCVSDSLGNVSSTPYDISEHKSEEQKLQSNLVVVVTDINERLKKLEDSYEKSLIKSDENEFKSDKANVGNDKKYGKSTSNAKSDGNEQSESK